MVRVWETHKTKRRDAGCAAHAWAVQAKRGASSAGRPRPLPARCAGQQRVPAAPAGRRCSPGGGALRAAAGAAAGRRRTCGARSRGGQRRAGAGRHAAAAAAVGPPGRAVRGRARAAGGADVPGRDARLPSPAACAPPVAARVCPGEAGISYHAGIPPEPLLRFQWPSKAWRRARAEPPTCLGLCSPPPHRRCWRSSRPWWARWPP